MISHYHKCIFIHIPKAAGTSIETFFLDNLGLDFEDKHALLLGKTTNLYLPPASVSHLTAQQMISQFYISEELFENYFKFSFVRNPIDRLFSSYKYLGYAKVISFDTFILQELPRLFKSKFKMYFLQTQTSFIYNEQNELMVDYVGKLENINDDFFLIQRRLNLEGIKLPHVNKSGYKYDNLRGLKKLLINPRLIFKLNFSKKGKKCSHKALQVIKHYYEEDFSNFNYNID